MSQKTLTLRMTRATTCTVPECEKPVIAHGWCTTHYKRWKRQGDPLVNHLPPVRGTCSVDGCTRDATNGKQQLCNLHYQRLMNTGSLELVDRPWKERGSCSVSGCVHIRHTGDLCLRHYLRDRKGYPLEAPWRKGEIPLRHCEVDGCSVELYARGLCRNHYQRLRHQERIRERETVVAA